MGKMLILALAVSFSLVACASQALRQDCLARQAKVEHVAAVADAELRRGITANDVRALLGEPDEIIQAPKLGDLETWRYYVYADCMAYLDIHAPETKLFFINGVLMNWATYERH
jgi:outer membrane protein assembly factor BamE (lipoprotein component of BamABCDE complex)